ncbi:MAG: small subunit ribosomal protein S20 [Chloroflexi bacterium]|nr:MAG: small subunit ribosomal protein S20 [Chloroflexota bacterium]
MPSEKARRTSVKKAERNKATRSLAKSIVSRTRKAIASGDMEAANTANAEAASVLDKAVKKGSLHPNNAARRKSRLATQVSRLV